jgi:phosphocarrier protein HPr
MLTQQCTIINKLGLHARAASKLVSTASRFAAEVELHKGDRIANAKSIMGIMMLAATQGTPLVLHATGSDAQAALDAIVTLINNRFDEDE